METSVTLRSQNKWQSGGINGKMNEIQAALGLVVLDCIEEERRKRKVLSDRYKERLKAVEGITCLHNDKSGIKNSYQYFVIRIDEKLFGQSRDNVHEELKKYNVITRKYFYPLCSNYNCYKHLPSAAAVSLPVGHKISHEALSLPFYGGLSEVDVEKFCLIIWHIRTSPKSAASI